ncbi:hypothetical protein F0Q45_12725 [Mycobacterium simiae]|uniref:Uncharacterized protein n=1 Tax=Mycobacterium simiae TaxID=1784 RepID=A0A5B1BR82_MYCSI|nr:hypothetical protein [Mycobacterium simiae]KAA1249863.1 hypothetical protein F0Q45_12725 [Mycobacterium simiae]
MVISEMHISRQDVDRYVRDTLPYDEITEWDADGIAAELIAAYPDLLGFHPDLLDMPITSYGPAGAWIDCHIDGDRYQTAVRRWQMTYDSADGIADLRDLSDTELKGLYDAAAVADDAGLMQSIRALRGQPPLVILEISHRQEDGSWRGWEAADYEFGPLRRHELPPRDELTSLLRDYVGDICTGGEWLLEAKDADTGCALAESEILITDDRDEGEL